MDYDARSNTHQIYLKVSCCKTLRNATFMFVAVRPTAHQMYIIEKCMYFYSIHVCVCVCVCVRALLIVKCARTLKITVGAMIKPVGKIIQSREVKNVYEKLYARTNLRVSKVALPARLGLRVPEQRVTQKRNNSLFDC